MILREGLKQASFRLATAGVPSPEVDARLIAAHLAGVKPLLLDQQGKIPEGFFELVARREAREPLQHILGSAPFGHLDLAVGPGVFIPRPETEVLADWALRQLPKPVGDGAAPVVVDLCTGSGALAAYISSLRPDAQVIAVDSQPVALDYARKNAPSVTVVAGDVTEAILPELYGRVDLVVSNPPYVPEDLGLEPEVYADPHEAVFAGKDGMSVITEMMPLVFRLLKDGGVVGVEHDDATSKRVQHEFLAAGLSSVEVLADLSGRARFVIGMKKSH